MIPSFVLACVVLAGPAPAGPATGVRVVDETREARCPDEADVVAALTRRLGDATARDGNWTLRYRHTPAAASAAPRDAGAVDMALDDDAGRTHVNRKIPLGTAPCATAADAMAIIVERTFLEIGWTRGTPLPAPKSLPTPPPSPPSSPPSPSREPGPSPAPAVGATAGPEAVAAEGSMTAAPTPKAGRSKSSTAVPAEVPDPHVAVGPPIPVGAEVALQPSFLSGGGTAFLLGAGLGLRVGPVITSLTIFLPQIEREESVAQGSVHSTAFPIAASVRWNASRGDLFFRLGFDALARRESGEGVDLVDPRSASRIAAALGLGLGAGTRVGQGGLVSLDLSSLFYRLPASEFAVGGVGHVLEPPRFQLLAGIRLALSAQ